MEYKINNTEFVLLLLIAEHKSCTGYTMRSLVEDRGYAAWSGVSSSSIYVTLKKLEDRGLTTSRPDEEKSTKGPTGRLFELSADGQKAVMAALIEALSSCREHEPRYNIALCGIEFLSKDQLRSAFEKRLAFLEGERGMLKDLSQSEEMPLSAQFLYERILAGLGAEISWMKIALARI